MDRLKLGESLRLLLEEIWEDEEKREKLFRLSMISFSVWESQETALEILMNKPLPEQAMVLKLIHE